MVVKVREDRKRSACSSAVSRRTALLFLVLAFAAGEDSTAERRLPLLTNVSYARSLSPERAETPTFPADLMPGSRIQVEGKSAPGNFLPVIEAAVTRVIGQGSQGDVVVFQTPPWLTRRLILSASGGLGGLALAAWVWVLVLRRRVRTQTAQIRQELEREAELEARYKRVFESANDLIQIVGLDGRILYVNPAWHRVLGYSPDEISRLSLFDIIHPDARDHCQPVFAALTAGQEVDSIQTMFQAKDGRRVHVEGHCAAEIVDGRIEAIHGIFFDITERTSLEAHLRHAHRMESIGQLAAGVAHDFNNILTIIGFNCSLVRQTRGLGREAARCLDEAIRATERASNLTRQLLLFSRRQAIQRRVLDLSAVITETAGMLRRSLGEHIDLRLECAPDLPAVEGDPAMLEQVLVNLAANSRDAMPSGGRLSLRTWVETLGPRNLRGNPEAREGRFVCLSVSDTGCGMDTKTLSRAFDPFFTTKEIGKGTGLGLSTVYGIVKQHQGWIEARSEVGKGTEFEIYFPAVTTRPPAPPVQPQLPGKPDGQGTVLLVEDEAPLRLVVGAVLKKGGYRVLPASDATEALALWREQRDQIDLLLTDMMMPGGMSGGQLAELLRREKPSLKVIYTSGYNEDTLRAERSLLPDARFIKKPCPPAALIQAIRESLEGTPMAPEAPDDAASDLNACAATG
ncbi:MAG: PAS domain S-box protein [Acidobacteriota bacterium]